MGWIRQTLGRNGNWVGIFGLKGNLGLGLEVAVGRWDWKIGPGLEFKGVGLLSVGLVFLKETKGDVGLSGIGLWV